MLKVLHILRLRLRSLFRRQHEERELRGGALLCLSGISIVPARRASRVDPLAALRYE